MTVRSSRLVGFVGTGALVAGLAVVPLTSTTASASSDDPVFYPVEAEAVATSAGGEAAAARLTTSSKAAKAKVKKSKGEQILQIIRGIQGVGNNGLAVAAGPKQVIQMGGQVARAYAKNNGRQVATKSINQFFGIGNATAITQPTVIYDPIGKRFIAAAITESGGGDVALVLRISKTSAATPFSNKKWRKSVAFDSDGSVDEAQPQIGVSSDKIVVTATADDVAEPNRIFFFPKSAYFKGNTSIGAWAADLNSTYNGQSPAVNASKQPNIFVAIPATVDVTVTTYTGAATDKEPKFSQSRVYPTKNLTLPPTVLQNGGDSLDLGPLAFSGVAWRNNRLYAAATVNCTGFACIRVFGINTGSGVSLMSDEKISSNGVDLFSPDVAIDGAGNVHLTLTDVGTKSGPSQAVLVRKGANNWTKPRFVRKGNGLFDGPGGSSDWWMSNSAALDPTSPWDVWVTGPSGDNGVPANGLTTRIARVSLAKNVATLRTSSNRVNKGRKVTFTVKLARPGGDTIRGLPVALQRKPVSGGQWKNVKSAKTAANGTARWNVKIKKAGLYRTLGKRVSQNKKQGLVFDQVTSKSQRVRLR